MFGNKAASYGTVKNWFNEFNRGRSSLKDDCREGYPTAFVPENINVMRELIMQARPVTYRVIEAFLVISSTRKHSILQEHLAVKNFCFR